VKFEQADPCMPRVKSLFEEGKVLDKRAGWDSEGVEVLAGAACALPERFDVSLGVGSVEGISGVGGWMSACVCACVCVCVCVFVCVCVCVCLCV